MNYNNSSLVDELAAQYALGTLRGPARRQFERLCRRNLLAARALHHWEDRLVDLAAGITPVRPSAAVWRAVQQRVRDVDSHLASGWRRTQWALAASVLLAVFVSSWVLLTSRTELVATIADQQQMQLWHIEATAERDELRIASAPAVPVDPEHAYELWALPASGAAPVSLGLMPQSGKQTLQLSQAQRLALASATKVAISLEPREGSPTGAPTGPVLYVAAVVIEG